MLGLLALVSGCGRAPGSETVLELRVHSLSGCDLPSALASGSVELSALGDFSASNDAVELLPLDARHRALSFPAATRAVLARVAGGDTAFGGYGELRSDAGLDLLLWPEQATCRIWPERGHTGYPGRYGGQALGFSPQLGRVVAVGGSDALISDAIVGALSFDVTTGLTSALGADSEGALSEPRAFATVTPFGARFLVAGGEQPVDGVPEADLPLRDTAELFDPKLGRFSGESIHLQSARAHHAAITLDDGRTLLVGGRARVGDSSIAQYQLELVDPRENRSSVGQAITPRIDPRVLRLSDGRIFVGGGSGSDGAPAEPVGEWLDHDAKLLSTRLSLDVAPRFGRAFVATLGGGLLAVGGCEDRPPASDQDAASCSARCRRGCAPLDGYDAWWIDADGAASPISLEGIAAPQPVLLPGSDGSPWLVAADASAPELPRLFRFNPWAQRFEPAATPDGLELPRADMPQPLALGGDLFVWTGDDAKRGGFFGLRLGGRSRYARDIALVLAADPLDPERPLHLVPSRPPGGGASYDGALTLRGAAARAALEPPDMGPDVRVQIADTDYADVTVKLHLASAELPRVALGSTLLGGSACPWPDGPARGGDFDLPTVLRREAHAELRFHGAHSSCRVEPGRLTLGLVAGDDVAVVSQLEVLRSLEAP